MSDFVKSNSKYRQFILIKLVLFSDNLKQSLLYIYFFKQKHKLIPNIKHK